MLTKKYTDSRTTGGVAVQDPVIVLQRKRIRHARRGRRRRPARDTAMRTSGLASRHSHYHPHVLLGSRRQMTRTGGGQRDQATDPLPVRNLRSTTKSAKTAGVAGSPFSHRLGGSRLPNRLYFVRVHGTRERCRFA